MVCVSVCSATAPGMAGSGAAWTWLWEKPRLSVQLGPLGRDEEKDPLFLRLSPGKNLRRPQAAHAQDRPKAAYQSFENGNEIKTTAHRGWDRTCGANLTELTTCYSKLNILQSAQRHTQRKVCPGHNTEVLHTQELGNEITSPRKRFIDTSLDTVQMLECQIRILKQLLWVYSTKQR